MSISQGREIAFEFVIGIKLGWVVVVCIVYPFVVL